MNILNFGDFIKHKTIIKNNADKVITYLYYENGKITNIDVYNYKKRVYENVCNDLKWMDTESVLREIKEYEEQEAKDKADLDKLKEETKQAFKELESGKEQ